MEIVSVSISGFWIDLWGFVMGVDDFYLKMIFHSNRH
jgi:hypothetical protein